VPSLDKIKAFHNEGDPWTGVAGPWTHEVAGFSLADLWHYEFDNWGLLGRLTTILALMFGAQFWFDVLRQLVGIRRTIGGNGGSSAG